MKTMKWLNVLVALAFVASLNAGAWAQDADTGTGSSLQGGADIEVVNNDIPAPSASACSICGGGCSPGNMRSTGGWATLNTTSDNGAQVTVHQYQGGYGQHFNFGASCENSRSGDTAACLAQTSGANGGAVSFYRNTGNTSTWGYYYYNGTCTNAGGSVSSRDTWENIISCFLKGTPILMADGTYKNIEDVKPGDQVMSYDPDTKQFVPSGVVNTTQSTSDQYLVINGDLKVTPAHELFINGQWEDSADIKPGDVLLGENGQNVTVTSVSKVTQNVDVYNLITDDPHDFFADHILAHNTNPGAEHKDHGFARGTKIALADGRLVPIERIKVGDKLISYDNVSRKYSIATVRGAGKQRVSQLKIINKTLRMGIAEPLFMAQNPEKKK